MQERHTNRRLYFDESARTSDLYYRPFIERFKAINPNSRILEVGCGEGGNLKPFAVAGCSVMGVDISTPRIDEACRFFAEDNLQGTFIASDIFLLHELEQQFDLILIHDVIEHIGDKVSFLGKIKNYLAPQGVIFIGFPAWQMPFGGHQQIAKSKLVSHFPFIHLLPRALYRSTLKMVGENDETIHELLDIKATRCSIEKFLRSVKQTHYQIIDRQLYFINPHYQTKFGIRPRKLNEIMGKIPYLRNFFTTGCIYLLRQNDVCDK